MDLSWYIKQYNFTDYDVRRNEALTNNLKGELHLAIGSKSTPFGVFRGTVYGLLSKLEYLRTISNKTFNPEYIWSNLSMDIFRVATERYLTYIDESFGDLLYYFSPESIYAREHKVKAEHVAADSTEFTRALGFIGITENYTQRELEKGYHKLCLIHHPDKGGETESFLKLQNAYIFLQQKLES